MKAAFFDVDGTLTDTNVWGGLMEYFEEHAERVWVNRIFRVFHYYFLYSIYKLGLIPQVRFREIWAKNLSWFLKGYSLEEAAKIWEWVVTQRINSQWRSATVEKLTEHKNVGDLVFLVSGGPEGLLERIAVEIGADYVVGTRHVVEGGFYTGKAPRHACQGKKKVTLARKVIEEHGLEIDLSRSSAYADSLGDLDLLEMVGHPVAVFPDEELRPVAIERGWEMIEA
jgi:HAD superfamily hydrolase (TIGR01490 family)